MARRATSLGPKPSLFVICFCCFGCFCCFVFVFFGGFKGQVRWPEGPPHLALNPPYWFIFVFFFPFLSLLLIEKKPVFPLKRAFLFIFCVSLSFSLNLFWPPLFLFRFLCLSLSLSLSLSCSCLSFFLLVIFFLLSFCFLFLSLFHFSFFFAFVFWKEQHEMFKLQFLFFINSFSFLWFSVLFFLSNPFSLSLFFPDFKLCLLFNMNVLGFKTNNFKNTNFWTKGGVATKRFFIKLCFRKCEKLSFFSPLFGPNFGWCSKNTVKIGIPAHFQKQKNEKKWPFSKVIIWAKLMLLSGPSLLQHKNGQLGPDNNFANFCAHLFFSKKMLKSLFL